MNKFNLSDNYSVMIEKPLCDYDRKTIMNLYLPIVGKKRLIYYKAYMIVF